jgi:two-component system, LytTR family, response regulator
MKAIIIEDEAPAREIIRNYLLDHPEIECIGEYADGFEGYKAIGSLKPDLIFLDVQMPKLTGFELLEILEEPPVIIFTTAYDQYAIKAFEMNATDYLLKPFSKERFGMAISKAFDKFREALPVAKELTGLLQKVNDEKEQLDRIVVKWGTKIRVLPLDQIVYFESQDDYVMIYTGSEKFLKQFTMKYLEDRLDARDFVRIHRSYIARVDQISQLEHFSKDTYLAVMKNGAKLKVSDSGYKNLREKLHF